MCCIIASIEDGVHDVIFAIFAILFVHIFPKVFQNLVVDGETWHSKVKNRLRYFAISDASADEVGP